MLKDLSEMMKWKVNLKYFEMYFEEREMRMIWKLDWRECSEWKEMYKMETF